MTLEVALWILGALVAPGIAWCVWHTHRMEKTVDGAKKVDEIHQKLIPVLEHPETSGFGTVGMDKVIEANTQAIRDNAHAVKTLTNMARYLYKEATGKEAPPV